MHCIAIVARTGDLTDRGLPFYMNAFKMIQSTDITMLYTIDDIVERNVRHMLPILRKVHSNKNISVECVSDKELHKRSLMVDELIICNTEIEPFIDARKEKLTIVPSYFKVPDDRVNNVKTVQRNVIVTAWFDCKRDNNHNKPGEREHHIDNFFKAVTNADIYVLTDNDLIPEKYEWMLHVHVIRKQLNELMLYSVMNWITACASMLGHAADFRKSEPNVHLVWFSKIPMCKYVSDLISDDYAYLAWHDIAIMYDKYMASELFTNDLIYPCFELYTFPQTFVITTAIHYEQLRRDIAHNRSVGGYWLFPSAAMLNSVFKLYMLIIRECIEYRITVPADEVLYTLMFDLCSNVFISLHAKIGDDTTYWGFIKQFEVSIHTFLDISNKTVRLPELSYNINGFMQWINEHIRKKNAKYLTHLTEVSGIF